MTITELPKREWRGPWHKNVVGRFIRGWIMKPTDLVPPVYGTAFAKEKPVDLSDAELSLNDYIFGTGGWALCSQPADTGTIHGLRYHTDHTEPNFLVNPVCHFDAARY